MLKIVLPFILITTFCLLMQNVSSQSAQSSLRERWKLLEVENQKIEEKQEKFMAKRRELKNRLKKASFNFYKCPNELWRVSRNTDVEKVETERKQLEEKWQKIAEYSRTLNGFRKKLEEERKTIEATKRSLAQYEKNMDALILKYRQGYINPYNDELFPKYNTYYSSMDNYITFLEGATEACNSKFDNKFSTLYLKTLELLKEAINRL